MKLFYSSHWCQWAKNAEYLKLFETFCNFLQLFETFWNFLFLVIFTTIYGNMNYNFINCFVTITRKKFQAFRLYFENFKWGGGGEGEATFTEFQKYFFLFFHFLIYGSKYACSKTKQLKLFNIFVQKNNYIIIDWFNSRHRKLPHHLWCRFWNLKNG